MIFYSIKTFSSAVRLGDPLTYQSTPKNKSAIVRVDIEQVFLHALKDIALIKLTTPVNYTGIKKRVLILRIFSFTFSNFFRSYSTNLSSNKYKL